MPRAVAIEKRTAREGVEEGDDRLVERGTKSAVSHHAQLPGKAASLDSGVEGRGVRRPVEPRGDGEIRGGNPDRGSRNSVSRVEVPRSPNLAGDIRHAGHRPVIP